MSGSLERLATALADRYRIERELGQGGMATVTADGRSFVFIKSPGLRDEWNHLVVTLNWFEELKQKVGK